MQIEVQKEEGMTVWFVLRNASTTVVEPVIEELNKDKNVVFARYTVDHPDLTDPVLEVKVTAGTPQQAVKAAAERVKAVFAEIKV